LFRRTKVLLAIGLSAAALPLAAQTPAPTTAFDGTYAGVSRTLETTMRGGATRSCPLNGQPAPVTISNGAARTLWGGTADGSVNSQGVLVMRAPNGARIDGQIDGKGTITGRITSACSYQVVWQKK
jgi:hypothetical protein